MSAPEVTVLLPVRDGAATLGEALDSLAAQTFGGYEILAVDDGSTDATSRILADRALADPRLRVLTLPPTGIVGALNAGLSAARGRYVARMDADDICRPDRLAHQKALLDENPDVGLASCLVEFAGDDRSQGYRCYVDWVNGLVSNADMALARFIESPIPHPTAFFRRDVVQALGGYRDGDFPEDYELWLRLFEAGVRCAKVAEPLLSWRDSPGRLSRVSPRYSPEAFYRLKAGYLARFLAMANPCHPKVVVVGAGRVARLRAELLTRHGVEIEAYVDIDPLKIGRTYGGRPVLSRQELPGPGHAFVLSYVGSRGAREEIEAFLLGSGYRPGHDFLMAA